MLPFMKPRSSTTVHHYHEQEQDCNKYSTSDEEAPYTSLTVWRKSLVFSCKGFTVIGSDGSLVYRVDNYSCRRPHRIILMDGSGNPIFTIRRRKKLRIVDYCWLIYEGEEVCKNSITSTSKKPIFCVRKNMSIMKTKPSVLAYVYGSMSKKGCKYTIEGSYEQRSCKIVDEWRRACSEIKKKKAMKGSASFGAEVFDLIVQPGFDSRFAMAIVLLLDQMFS